MAFQSDSSWLCRDCLADGAGALPCGQCPACDSWNIISHPELRALAIAHLDCDAFYAAIEKRDNPALANRAVIVGGGKRGVVATACYVARISGVRSAMPMFKALKLCPDAVVLPPRMEAYREAGRAIRALMLRLTPLVEPLSIDEAFLDLSGTEALHQRSPAASMAHLAKTIQHEIGISVSIGLSGNKSLAKMASEMDKPKGFHVIGMAESAEILAPMPVNVLYGTGQAMTKKLNAANIRTCGDLVAAPPRQLKPIAGNHAARLQQLAAGIDPRPIEPDQPTKSISAETTFPSDIADLDELTAILEQLSQQVARRLNTANYSGRRVVLKLKSAQHKLLTRSHTLSDPTRLVRRIFETALVMLKNEVAPDRYWRLIGVGVEQLSSADEADPLNFADDNLERTIALEDSLNQLRQRHGEDSIISGRQFARTHRTDDDIED